MKRHTCSISGVVIYELTAHEDERGRFTEILRDSWGLLHPRVQWNCVSSHPGVLRGVHVHAAHADYLTIAAGAMMVGLHDIRPESPTFGRSEMMTLTASKPAACEIPPGVCHGFYFLAPSVHVYAVSEYWDTQDELGCRFDCPELGMSWQSREPMLSARDANACDYAQMRAQFSRARRKCHPDRQA